MTIKKDILIYYFPTTFPFLSTDMKYMSRPFNKMALKILFNWWPKEIAYQGLINSY